MDAVEQINDYEFVMIKVKAKVKARELERKRKEIDERIVELETLKTEMGKKVDLLLSKK